MFSNLWRMKNLMGLVFLLVAMATWIGCGEGEISNCTTQEDSEIRGSCWCKVEPNPALIHSPYQVLGGGLPKNTLIRIIVADALGNASLEANSSQSGQISLEHQSDALGQAIVEIYRPGKQKDFLLTSCGFEVVSNDPQPCQTQAYQACYPHAGAGADVYWFDSCNQAESIATDCPDLHSQCVVDEIQVPKCGCVNHWDLNTECTSCENGWAGDDCNEVASDEVPYRAFSDDSYWNTPFPTDAPIDPHNTEYIADSQNSSHTQNFLAFTAAPGKTQAYGFALYWAKETDPLYTLADGKHFTTNNPVQVHIPLNAKPQSGSDGEIAVFDLATDQVIEMSGASFDGADWHIGATLDRFMLSSNGLDSRVSGANDQRNHGHRGITPSARGVRIDEVRAGVINHRLECYWWATGTQTVNHYWPMAGDEGSKGGIVPEGIVIRIKPSINLENRGLSAPALVIARALQVYGCMVGDNSGSGNRLKLEINEAAWKEMGLTYEALAPIPWSDWEFIQGGYIP